MKSTDARPFALILAGYLTEIYEKAITPALLNVWFATLKPYDLADVQAAFNCHIADPDAGRYSPKPADIIRQIHAAQPGVVNHPGPEEAWGLLLRFVNDEQETGLYTEPMRDAWAACASILKTGDEVGARMCFLETYKKAIRRAVEARQPPKWSLTMGTDPERRKIALNAAVERGQISADYARSLLPAPPASLEEVAGLLESDVVPADPDQPSLAQRFQALATQLRASQAEEENQAIAAERERRADIDARKAKIQRVMDAQIGRTA